MVSEEVDHFLLFITTMVDVNRDDTELTQSPYHELLCDRDYREEQVVYGIEMPPSDDGNTTAKNVANSTVAVKRTICL